MCLFKQTKKINGMKELKIIDTRFLLTPFATTIFFVNNVERKRYYIFGFKIIDLAV